MKAKGSKFIRMTIAEYRATALENPLRAAAVETKTARGRLRPSQVRCLESLRAAGAVVCVARSLDDLQVVIEKRREVE